jgi:hypothetical protein
LDDLPLEPVEPLEAPDEEGDEAPLELDGDEALAPLEDFVEPVEAEPELSLTPRAARVFWSSLPEA